MRPRRVGFLTTFKKPYANGFVQIQSSSQQLQEHDQGGSSLVI